MRKEADNGRAQCPGAHYLPQQAVLGKGGVLIQGPSHGAM